MKLLFLQLPGTPTTPDDGKENIPFAAGCLAAHLKKKWRGKKLEIVIPNHQKLNSWGDYKLLQYIKSKKPDWLLLTLYLWNSERSLYIAERVKKSLKQCKIVVGGPEVAKDNNWLFKNKSVDYFVSGEGETALFNVLRGKARKGFINQERLVEKFDSPYSSGTLPARQDNPMLIETQRGCPFNCTFCYYPKEGSMVRQMPLSEIKEILHIARLKRVREIIFTDPTFNNYKPFEELLNLLIKMNPDGKLSYHAEIKPHLLTDAEIEKINQVGFRTLEVGLQSIKRSTQKKIKCLIPLEKFSRNVQRISSKISVRLDVISGLPGESPGDVDSSIKYAMRNHPRTDLYLYHLSVLPGTEMRRQTPNDCYQKRPPYFITNNGRIKQNDFLKINSLFEKTTGEKMDEAPDIVEIYSKRKKYNYLLFTKKSFEIPKKILGRISMFNVLEFRFKSLSGKFCNFMLDSIEKITKANPYSTFYIFVTIPGIKPSTASEEIIMSAKLVFNQYANRCLMETGKKLANLRIAFSVK